MSDQLRNAAATDPERTSMFRCVFRQFFRRGSARSAMAFAVAYGAGLICMVVAFKILVRPSAGLLGIHRASELSLLIYYTFFWMILALPAVCAAAAIWVTSRRDLIMPPAASMAVIFGTIAAVYYSSAKSASNDWNAVVQTLIGFHGVLMLISIPVIRWWLRRDKSQ